jgi:hypothetical protein
VTDGPDISEVAAASIEIAETHLLFRLSYAGLVQFPVLKWRVAQPGHYRNPGTACFVPQWPDLISAVAG